MAEIRYIASLSDNPDRLARFYGNYFGLTELGRSNEGDVSLTDGHYNFSVLKMRPVLKEPRNEIGLHHIGLQVESISAVRDRYLKFNPRGTIAPEPDDLHHGEIRIYDPEMNPVTLSEGPFAVDGDERRYPRIAHIAFQFGSWHKRSHRVHHYRIESPAPNKGICNFQRLFTRIWLRNQQIFQIDTDRLRQLHIQGVLSVHECANPACALGLGNYV